MRSESFEPTLNNEGNWNSRGDALARIGEAEPIGRFPPAKAGSKHWYHTAWRGFLKSNHQVLPGGVFIRGESFP
jgi:hypothetical protein